VKGTRLYAELTNSNGAVIDCYLLGNKSVHYIAGRWSKMSLEKRYCWTLRGLRNSLDGD